MTGAHLQPWKDWIGRERVTEDTVTLERALKLAATLDADSAGLRKGAPLPAGWHWTLFHEVVPQSALAADGHERRGDFLPPIALDRRMWAGGRLRFYRALKIGAPVQRISTVRSVDLKEGRSGPLAFVTVEHRLTDAEGVVLEEEQDLVYLNRSPAPPMTGSTEPAKGAAEDVGRRAGEAEPRARADWSEVVTLDEVALFRFSALTFNGHRIHYDRPYATEVEHYPDLVVHGPLVALLLLGAGLRWTARDDRLREENAPVRFQYRALQPLYCNESFELNGTAVEASGSESAVELRAHGTRGLAMRAELIHAG